MARTLCEVQILGSINKVLLERSHALVYMQPVATVTLKQHS